MSYLSSCPQCLALCLANVLVENEHIQVSVSSEGKSLLLLHPLGLKELGTQGGDSSRKGVMMKFPAWPT